MIWSYHCSSLVFFSHSFFYDAIEGNEGDLTQSKNDDKDSGLSGAEKPVSVPKEPKEEGCDCVYVHLISFTSCSFIYLLLFYWYYISFLLEVKVLDKPKNSRKPVEIKKAALCNDTADEGGGSEKQKYLLFSLFLVVLQPWNIFFFLIFFLMFGIKR